MASATPNGIKPSKPQLLLIPWDTASPSHVQRLVDQRIACGWDYDDVERWRALQDSGKLNTSWLVLPNSDPETESRLLKHTIKHPQESTPLVDSAVSFGGKPRTIPSPQRSFIPIGHICLSAGVPTSYINTGYVDDEPGLYWISNFYISRALQGSGLGSAALDTIEEIAMSEPLNARVLAMNAINKEDPEREEKHEALGIELPLFSNQEWYERRGYKVTKHVEKLFSKVDKMGKTWYWNAVFLKKVIS